MSNTTYTVDAFFDPATWTISYVLTDTATNQCAVIDSVLDYDPKSGRTGTATAERIIARIGELGARVEWLLETHVHADHFSAAPYLQSKLGGRIAIGEHVRDVQKMFGALFNAGPGFAQDGSQFDQLFADGETFNIGQTALKVLYTPGHTPACVTYLVEDADQPVAFVGDTLFMPDYGTARCDFPGGDAATLFRSINRVLSLPAHTRLYMCHDYQPGGRTLQYESTVADERANNIHVRNGTPEQSFIEMRRTRDATLDMPVLILPAVQINMRAGHFPEPEANGTSYIKIPLNAL